MQKYQHKKMAAKRIKEAIVARISARVNEMITNDPSLLL
jgi:hypothetical protein